MTGEITRGTTHQNRLRRVDRWILAHAAAVLAAGPPPAAGQPGSPPLVIDLGFGRVAQTTIELADRLATLGRDVEVLGLEIDRARVAEAVALTRPGLGFAHGGFELAGRTGVSLIRVMNVLRQYDEGAVQAAWDQVCAGLHPGGLLVEGTCDELGRLGSWVVIRRGSGPAAVPEALVFAAAAATLGDPARFAERLPKALIHRNVPGERVHAFLGAWSQAWARSAAQAPFGPRARFVAAARLLQPDWPLHGGPSRWRLGELTVAWAAVAPR